MSIIHFGAMTSSADPIVVTLSGNIVGVSDPNYGYGGYRFNADGTVTEINYFSQYTVSSLTDWIFPRTTFDPSDYEVRFAKVSGGGNVKPGSDTFGAWIDLSVSPQFTLDEYRLAATVGNCVADIRHATDGTKNTVSSLNDAAPCMATAAYVISLEIN